jgi:class 3 adenylate cyclase
MDRHYIEDGTRHAIANAHEKDLEIQHKHGVQFLTYWFDEERCTTFCLVDAPNKDAIQTTHDEAHGDVPHEIIEVDPQVVQAFLGRVQDPTPPENSEEVSIDSAFRTIMFTDLKDSTLLSTMFGDAKALHLIHVHNALTRNTLKKYNGTEVKHTGDGIMASFVSVSEAVDCAIAIQKAFDTYNQDNPDEALYLRIGLSAGEPIEEGGDFFGSAVNLAARLCAHAEPSQILAAQIVRDQSPGQEDAFVDRGKITPKGFEHAVQMYEIQWDE